MTQTQIAACLLLSLIFSAGITARATAQGNRAAIIAKTADNAGVGLGTRWDFGATDMTFKADKKEVWILEAYPGPAVTIVKFKADDLAAAPSRVLVNLPVGLELAPVLGLAEITNGGFKGKNLILIDPTFATDQPAQTQIAIYEDDGNLLAGESFLPITGLGDTVRLTSIDVHPEREELAAYDVENHAIFVLDFTFSLLAGPIELEGFACQFATPWFFGAVNRTGLRGGGIGISYSGADRLLATSAFKNIGETHWALEYDLLNQGAFASQALDLSAAGLSGLNPDLAFIACATGQVGNEPAFFAYNQGDDAIYAFSRTLDAHAPPVELMACAVAADSGNYSLTWNLPADATAFDGIAIVENGATVATLPADATSYTSPLPLLGKGFFEVATLKAGKTSEIRDICELESSRRPAIDGVQFDGAQITTLGVLSGLATDPEPGSPAEFRCFVIGPLMNDMEVVDVGMNPLPAEQFIPDPRVVTPAGSGNVSAIGVAILTNDGIKQLAILDPDGPTDSGIPSATFHSLDNANRTQLVLNIDAINLTAVSPTPSLFDWDTDADNNFVAGAMIPGTQDFAVVRILFDGTSLTATQMVLIPHRDLTPFTAARLTGAGVSVLPSGNLLVCGSDTFSKTYTEALLMTPFLDAAPGRAAELPRFVGYAQGLPVPNQFFGFGPGLGPRPVFGLETSFFRDAGLDGKSVGVTYVPTGNIDLIANPAANQVLRQQALIVIHGTNDCSDPLLKAEQLEDSPLDVAPAASASGGARTLRFLPQSTSDFFVYVINQSPTDVATLGLTVELGGAAVAEVSPRVSLPAGRYARFWLRDRLEKSLAVSVTNSGATAARVRVITGAMGLGTDGGVVKKRFRRGDCDGNGQLNLTDAIFGLNWLFKGSSEPACVDTADSDDDGKVSLTDMVQIVNFLFKAGTPPAAPGPENCGEDPTDDELVNCNYTCQ